MYKVTLAIRYLLKRRITYFAVLSVALCVFIVLVVMTVMNGLVRDFAQRNHDYAGDCVVGTDSLVGFAYYEEFIEQLEKQNFIEGISPVVKSYGLKRRKGSSQDEVVEIMGINPARHSRATGFAKTLYFHKDDVSKAFVPSYDPNLNGCIPGIDLMMLRDSDSNYAQESILYRIGYSISCFPLTSRGALAQAGTDVVNTQTFYYSDHSQSGLPKVDGSVVYIPFENAQLLCGMGGSVKRVNAIHIKFKAGTGIQAGCDSVASLWENFKQQNADKPQAFLMDTVTVQNWRQNRRASIAPMEKEEAVMIIMFGFVGITTVFIVLVVFYMIVSHKSKDIGILKSVGVSNLDIIELFSGFAFLVGLSGSCIGTLTGWLFLMKINRIEDWLFAHFGFQLWDRTMYAIGDIPSKIEPNVLIIIFISAIAACLLGAFIPSLQAATAEPVKTLQVGQL
jgi:lipoprotein-releasing system permease protein